MSSLFEEIYDSEYALALYIIYESGDDSKLNELIKQLCPLIGRLARSSKSIAESGDQEFIQSDAMYEVYRLVEKKDVPSDSEALFTSFLTTAIRRFFYDSRTQLHGEIFEYWRVARPPDSGQVATHFDVESKMYVEQVIQDIRDDVASQIRFAGTEGDACRFILDCRLGFKNLEASVVKRKYGFSTYRCKFFTAYVEVLVKAAFWEYGKDERKHGPLQFDWATGRSLLRVAGELREV